MITNNYISWLNLSIGNNYFSDGVIPGTYIKAFDESVSDINNYEVMVNQVGQNTTFHAGVSHEAPIDPSLDLAGLHELFFELIIPDALFFNYTELPFPAEDQLFLLTNNSENPLFHSGPFVSKQDMITIRKKVFSIQAPKNVKQVSIVDLNTKEAVVSVDNAEANSGAIGFDLNHQSSGLFQIEYDGQVQNTFFLTDNRFHPSCKAIIRISINDLKNQSSGPAIGQIKFQARQSYLGYKVVFPESFNGEVNNPVVKDSDGAQYSGPEDVDMPNGQKAMMFKSKSPVQLKEFIDNNPVLTFSYVHEFSSRSKQVEILLPTPNSGNISKYNEPNNSESFLTTTLIYV